MDMIEDEEAWRNKVTRSPAPLRALAKKGHDEQRRSETLPSDEIPCPKGWPRHGTCVAV
jgi:hypothetical protein